MPIQAFPKLSDPVKRSPSPLPPPASPLLPPAAASATRDGDPAMGKNPPTADADAARDDDVVGAAI